MNISKFNKLYQYEYILVKIEDTTFEVVFDDLEVCVNMLGDLNIKSHREISEDEVEIVLESSDKIHQAQIYLEMVGKYYDEFGVGDLKDVYKMFDEYHVSEFIKTQYNKLKALSADDIFDLIDNYLEESKMLDDIDLALIQGEAPENNMAN